MTGRVLSVTGHRPDKVGGYDEVTFGYLVATARLCLVFIKPEVVLTGMALGWDMAVAQACFELGIPYTPCIPFKGQECKWCSEQQALYHQLIAAAPCPAVYVSEPPYSPAKMDVRNRYMVDNSEHTLALWSGDPKGGTANCVRYAIKKRRMVSNAWSRLQDLRSGIIDPRRYQSPIYPAVPL